MFSLMPDVDAAAAIKATVRYLNLMLELADISDQDRSCISHDIVIVAKLAQMAAFHDGLRLGRQEAAKRIASECKKMR